MLCRKIIAMPRIAMTLKGKKINPAITIIDTPITHITCAIPKNDE